MAIKYICDVCKADIPVRNRILLIGSASTEIDTLCIRCWKKAEDSLLSSVKIQSIELDS